MLAIDVDGDLGDPVVTGARPIGGRRRERDDTVILHHDNRMLTVKPAQYVIRSAGPNFKGGGTIFDALIVDSGDLGGVGDGGEPGFHDTAASARTSSGDSGAFDRSTPSHRATTAVARQLPSRFTEVRAISISSSTPRMTAIPSSGRPKVASVPARITSDARGTPATPLLVSMSVISISSCVPNDKCTPAAWATKTLASDKYNVDPSRLKLYPAGRTSATMCLGTPKRCMFSSALGSAASLDVVEKAIMNGSRTWAMKRFSGIFAIAVTKPSTTTTKNISAP